MTTARTPNNGNFVLRRVFFETERMKHFRRVCNVQWSTAYKYVEETGEYGSGCASPLHTVLELIGEALRLDRLEGRREPTAQEIVDCINDYYRAETNRLAAAEERRQLRDDFNNMLVQTVEAACALTRDDIEQMSTDEIKALRKEMGEAVAVMQRNDAIVAAVLSCRERNAKASCRPAMMPMNGGQR